MVYIIRKCPSCDRQSSEMKLLKKSKYYPEDENLKPSIPPMDNELLRCPCGRLLTWFDMYQINELEKYNYLA